MRIFHVDILAYPGMRLYDLAIAQEVFSRRPEMTSSRFDVSIVGASSQVATDSGLPVACLRMREHARRPDIIVVPGSEDRLGRIGPEELGWLRERSAEEPAAVIGLCTGAFVLAEAGLLEGKRATTHWRYTELLASRFPQIIGSPHGLYVRDGNIWTSAGVSAGVDALIAAVDAIDGAATADIIARSMVTPPRRQGSQAQFAPAPTRSAVHPFAALAGSIQDDPAHDWTVAELARTSNMSTRTFHRRFKETMGLAPGRWVTLIRLQEARALLETTALTIERIAHLSGFGGGEHLRQHFTAHFNLPPSTYRATMGHVAPRLQPGRKSAHGQGIPHGT